MRSMALSRFSTGTAALLLALFSAVSAPADPQDMLIVPLSIRSGAMGETGAADCREAANIACNPAVIALSSGVQITWSHSFVSYLLADLKVDGVLAGGGYRWNLSETVTIGGGLAAYYAKERLGNKGFDDDPPEWGAFERSQGAAAGAALGYRDIVRFSIGLAVKQWKWDNASDDEIFRQILEATIYDGGLAATLLLLRKQDYTVEAAAGFSYANFAGKIEVIRDPVFYADPGDIPAPEYRRYGLSVRATSPSWAHADKTYEMTLPVVSAAFNYDIVDEVFRTRHTGPRHTFGGEIGAFDMLFFRAGRISWGERDSASSTGETTRVDTTWGIGAGVAFRGYTFRFDYARRHIEKADVTQNRYGLLLEAGL